jgi:hypothetical protein
MNKDLLEVLVERKPKVVRHYWKKILKRKILKLGAFPIFALKKKIPKLGALPLFVISQK